MERVQLGASGIEVSRFCFGTWNVNTKGQGWGPADEQQAISLVHHTLASGCNFLDTARGYGDSEEILGRALKGRRDEVVVATKMVQCPPEQVAPTVETSLQNLQTDYIDLYICHWPSPSLSLDAFFEALVKEREAGRIRAIGTSNFNTEQMRIALSYGAVSLQPPFSILWRITDDNLAFCREQNISLTPYSPLAQGMLTGRFSRGDTTPEASGPRKGNVLFSDRMLPKSLAVAREVDGIANKLGCTSSQVALAWLLQTPGITCPIVGASRPEQWDQNLGALNVQLTTEQYERLDRMGREVWDLLGPEETMWGWKPK